jgi:phosphoribosylformylglycinamidine (FGAM) synthase PurS component
MSSDINPHENMCHAHRSSDVTNVAKVEVERIFYLQVEAEDDREHDEQEVEGVHGGGAKI